jgi:hypothetical protein
MHFSESNVLQNIIITQILKLYIKKTIFLVAKCTRCIINYEKEEISINNFLLVVCFVN